MSTPRIHAIHVKAETSGERGLPKTAVPEARIERSGLLGDFNRYRHESCGDDPGQAVLLHSLELLAELAHEGWPVEPGHLGENLLLCGIDYRALREGTRMRFGDVEIALTKPAEPCKILKRLPYALGARGTAFIQALVGRRGWYAQVLREGTVRVGDPVEVC